MSWAEDDRYYPDVVHGSRTGLVIVVAIVVSAATVGGLYLGLGEKTSQVRVPAVVGLPLAQARTVALKAGLALLVSDRAADLLIEAGSIASQTPLAGSNVPRGARLAVTLSTGPAAPPAAPIPHTSTPTPPSPAAVRPAPTTPTAAAPAAPAGDRVKVPKVRGVRLPFARRRLRAAGLRVGTIRRKTDEDHMDGMVLSQSPRRGAMVRRGAAIDLVVNSTE